jgi:hypothetical protein
MHRRSPATQKLCSFRRCVEILNSFLDLAKSGSHAADRSFQFSNFLRPIRNCGRGRDGRLRGHWSTGTEPIAPTTAAASSSHPKTRRRVHGSGSCSSRAKAASAARHRTLSERTCFISKWHFNTSLWFSNIDEGLRSHDGGRGALHCGHKFRLCPGPGLRRAFLPHCGQAQESSAATPERPSPIPAPGTLRRP